MTPALSGPFIDTSLINNSFEAKQASLKKIFHCNPTPVRIEIVKDDEPEARVPIHTNLAPPTAPQVNIPGSTMAMPSQEFFAQLIKTMKNIKAPQQPSKIVGESRDHEESVNLAKLQNSMLQLMYATGDVKWDEATVKNICTATFAQDFMNLFSMSAAVQSASPTNLFNTILMTKQEDK
jgi:hypothetical protein